MVSELQSFLQNAATPPNNALAAGRGRGGRGRAAIPVAAPPAPADPSAPLTPEQIKTREDFILLANQHQLKLDGDLTSDQKTTWETYKIGLFLDPKLKGVTLSDTQKDTIKSLVADTVKAIAKLTDGKDLDPLLGRLYRKIVGDILTEPQAAWLLQSGTLGAGQVSSTALAGGFGGPNTANAGGGNAAGGGFAGGGGGGRGGRGGGGAGGGAGAAGGGGGGFGGGGGGGRGGRGGGGAGGGAGGLGGGGGAPAGGGFGGGGGGGRRGGGGGAGAAPGAGGPAGTGVPGGLP